MAVLIHWKADVLSQITIEFARFDDYIIIVPYSFMPITRTYLMFCLFVTGTKSNAKKKNCDSVHYVIRSNSIGMKLASVGDLNFFKNVIQKSPPLLNLISKYFGRRN
ncbi:hypothetical protein T03_10370 [Trichinella britovi]|uniref:Uncharacterized protein n=1 Tax=Trichinella britovi TaxID=45882 RepID=A0A0V1DC58_TRIBR|nr:hypothetical protein T03_10370 [Trichinella britovi]